MNRRRTARDQRIWNDGYVTGYKAAHGRLQTELRVEFAGKLQRVRDRVDAILTRNIRRAR